MLIRHPDALIVLLPVDRNDLTYYRSLLCLEESHFRFYLVVRDGTAPPSPGSKPSVLTSILTDIKTSRLINIIDIYSAAELIYTLQSMVSMSLHRLTFQ